MMMKSIFAAAAMLSLLAACNSAPKADEATTTEAKEAAAGTGAAYKVDAATSRLTWVGSKPGDRHEGTFVVDNGNITVDGANITGGNFDVQLTSLSVTDLEGKEKGSLEGHLKSPDFFDVAKYPKALFTITSVAPFDSTAGKSLLAGATHTISGNLQLKDSTQNISFPARVTMNGNSLTADADFNIDRTRWGLNYKGPNNPQDFIISKEVNLKLKLAANKQ